jgi:hypothetical protein
VAEGIALPAGQDLHAKFKIDYIHVSKVLLPSKSFDASEHFSKAEF